jgi:cbb3-type cytochrome oxidase subunit 3
MISNVLRAIGGIGVYDAISIVLFVLVFAGAVVFACRLKKPFLKTMSLMPLNDQEGDTRHD